MPRETYTDVHYDRPLTNISCAYFQDHGMFVSGKFFPIYPVLKASDTFDTYPQGYWNRIYDTVREEESVANSISYKVSKDSYSVGDDALRIFISDKKRANVDVQRKLDMEATLLVTQAISLAKEATFVDTFMQAASWATAYVGADSPTSGTNQVDKWSDEGSSPVEQIKEACKTVMLKSAGRMPNKMIITYDVWIKLTEHADLKDRVKHSGGVSNNTPAQVTMAAVAELFQIEEIMVMKSIANESLAKVEDATTGLPAVDNKFLATGTVLLGHVPPAVGLMTPCAGITFAWNAYINHSEQAGPSIRRYRPTDGRKGEYIEAELSIQQKLVSKDMGAIFTGLI